MVKVHNYDNPTNRCPTCRHTVAFRQGCCDNFDNTDSCVGQDRCDNSFFYCLKALDSRPDSDPRDTSRCGFHSSEGTISHRNEDGAPIDFTRSTPLGIPNPFQLAGITAKWKVTMSHDMHVTLLLQFHVCMYRLVTGRGRIAKKEWEKTV